MGFKITVAEAAHPAVIAEERLWLTAGRDRVVAEGDEEAAFLFAGVGQRIPWADAVRYGLIETVPGPVDEPAEPEHAGRQKGRRKAPAAAETPTANEPAVPAVVSDEAPAGGLTIVTPDGETGG